MATTEHGYFLIADITGYTAYLNTSELEHAHEVLQALLELLIRHTRPPLVISRLAGDAVISYGLRDNFVQGQTFIESIEDTYVAFRRAIDLMVLNTSCDCRACANIVNLDLKFFIHYGAFTRQRLDLHDELLGADVIVIHRLLKNTVTETTGLRAYALYTDAAIRQLGIEDVCAAMIAHTEPAEHTGETRIWIQDMRPVWEARRESLRITIPPEQVLYTTHEIYPLPPGRVWDALTIPAYRALFMGAVRQNVLNRQHGRIGVGSQYECFHGNGKATIQTVLEWIPFEQMTTEDLTPVPKTGMLIQLRVSPVPDGTRLDIIASKSRGPWLNRTLCDLVAGRMLPATFTKGLADLKQLLLEQVPGDEPVDLRPIEIDLAQLHESIRSELARNA